MMDGWTDERMDGWTDRLIEKIKHNRNSKGHYDYQLSSIKGVSNIVIDYYSNWYHL